MNNTLQLSRGRLHPVRGGGVLVLALVSVVTVAALTAAILQLSTSVTRRQSFMREKMLAFYAAEAGLAESWAAVQVKKTGAVGSEEDPAAFGDGLFWVESTDLGDGLIRLDSTGMVGSGRATLSLVVEEGHETVAGLGVYSGGELELPPGSFLDGYDSRLGYGPDGAHSAPSEAELEGLLDDFLFQLGGDALGGSPSDASFAQGRGLLGGGDSGSSDGSGGLLGGLLDPVGDIVDPVLDPVGDLLDGSSEDEPEYSGRILSGGPIAVSGTSELPTVLQGDLVPGPGSEVSLSGDVAVTGETDPATSPVALPTITVPVLPELPSVQHSGAAPLLVLPTESSLAVLGVMRGAEVIIQGPSRLVVGSLQLAAGATLYLDTTDGPVEIFVTDAASLAASARLRNSTEDPTRFSLNLTLESEQPIGLPAAGPLHGVIYAPDAELSVPANFELFGSLVAESVTFGGPPKLHFDEYLVEFAAEQSKPRLVSWQILELANDLERDGGDPFRSLGVDRLLLRRPADAHADNPLSVEYVDGLGATANYNGPESGFDWGAAQTVKELKRGGKTVIAGSSALRVSAASDGGLLDGLLSALTDFVSDLSNDESDVVNRLRDNSPLSRDVLQAFLARSDIQSSGVKSVLEENLPLSDTLLKGMLNHPNTSSSDAKSLLLDSSPGLSSAVLALAQTELTPGDFAAVQAAQ